MPLAVPFFLLPTQRLYPFPQSRRLLCLLGLVSSELGLGVGLDRSLRSTDGRDTLDSGGSKVGTVARLGSQVGNGLVGPFWRHLISLCCRRHMALSPPRTFSLSAFETMFNLLSARLVATVGGLDESLDGLSGIRGLLADNGNAALLVRDDTNSLIFRH